MSKTDYINAYEISRFKSDAERDQALWLDIHDYIDRYGDTDLTDYLRYEKRFLRFLAQVYEAFANRPGRRVYGFGSVNFLSISSTSHHPASYTGLMHVPQRLKRIAGLSVRSISISDRDFLIRCWIRGFCDIEILSGSFEFICAGSDKMSFHYETFYVSEEAVDKKTFKYISGLYCRIAQSINPVFLADCSTPPQDLGQLVDPRNYQTYPEMFNPIWAQT